MVLRMLLGGELVRSTLSAQHSDLLSPTEREVYGENVVRVIRSRLGLQQFSEQEIFR